MKRLALVSILAWWFAASAAIEGKTWKMYVVVGPFPDVKECQEIGDALLSEEDKTKWQYKCVEKPSIQENGRTK